MKVSIIIPCYNSSQFLPDTIQSVRSQSFEDWELLLVDDGSTDDTVEIAHHHARIDTRIRVVPQANGGAAAARNRGRRESGREAPLVAFIDADDIWERGALSSLVALLDADPSCVAAYGLPTYFDGDPSIHRPEDITEWSRHRWVVEAGRAIELRRSEPTTLAAMLCHNWVSTPGQIVARRVALDRAGPFDESLRNGEDWDMWIRLAAQGPFAYLDDVVVSWRMHDSNKSGDPSRMERTDRTIRAKYRYATDPVVARAAWDGEWFTVNAKWRSKWSDVRAALRTDGVAAAFGRLRYTVRPSMRLTALGAARVRYRLRRR